MTCTAGAALWALNGPMGGPCSAEIANVQRSSMEIIRERRVRPFELNLSAARPVQASWSCAVAPIRQSLTANVAQDAPASLESG